MGHPGKETLRDAFLSLRCAPAMPTQSAAGQVFELRRSCRKCDVKAACFCGTATAAIAQLGERQTEDLKVPGSIPGLGIIHVAWSAAEKPRWACRRY